MRLLLGLALLYTALLAGGNVKIATYNVENLFDLTFDGSEYVEYIPNSSWQWNADNYRKKLHNLSRVIVDMDADVIALQEVESLEALRGLKAELNRKGLYYEHLAFAGKKNTTVKVALLSRHPVAYAKEVMVTAGRKYRNILEVKLLIENEPLYLFINHWKSKSGPESRRIISAKHLKKRIDELGAEHAIVLLGDFNSHFEEYRTFLRKRKHNDTDGVTGINHVLKTIDKGEPVTLEKLKNDSDLLFNLWYELPKKERWSHNYYGKKEGLDHIIISHGLVDDRGVEYVEESFRRFAPSYLFKKKGLYRWQKSKKHPKHHTGKGYSDHLPLIAEFKVVSRDTNQ